MFGTFRYNEETKSHEHVPLSRADGFEARGFTRIACQPCRGQKLKCSGESQGCKRCRKLGRRCTYNTSNALPPPQTVKGGSRSRHWSKTLRNNTESSDRDGQGPPSSAENLLSLNFDQGNQTAHQREAPSRQIDSMNVSTVYCAEGSKHVEGVALPNGKMSTAQETNDAFLYGLGPSDPTVIASESPNASLDADFDALSTAPTAAQVGDGPSFRPMPDITTQHFSRAEMDSWSSHLDPQLFSPSGTPCMRPNLVRSPSEYSVRTQQPGRTASMSRQGIACPTPNSLASNLERQQRPSLSMPIQLDRCECLTDLVRLFESTSQYDFHAPVTLCPRVAMDEVLSYLDQGQKTYEAVLECERCNVCNESGMLIGTLSQHLSDAAGNAVTQLTSYHRSRRIGAVTAEMNEALIGTISLGCFQVTKPELRFTLVLQTVQSHLHRLRRYIRRMAEVLENNRAAGRMLRDLDVKNASLCEALSDLEDGSA